MKLIPLNLGKFAQVDDEDYDYLMQFKWYYNKGYATRTVDNHKNQKTIRMHRVIINTPIGMQTDHIDGDKLNNCRSNLRICTSSQNKQNCKIHRNNTSGFKGVSWDGRKNRKWQAYISVSGRKISLGYYENPSDAAQAYDKAAKERFGEFANLNFLEA